MTDDRDGVRGPDGVPGPDGLQCSDEQWSEVLAAFYEAQSRIVKRHSRWYWWLLR